MVTRTGALPDGHPLFADPSSTDRHRAAADEVRARAALGQRMPLLGDDRLARRRGGRSRLAGRARRPRRSGLRRVSCEGGPTLNAALLAADAVDEVFLTLAPALVAGDGPRLSPVRQAHNAASCGSCPCSSTTASCCCATSAPEVRADVRYADAVTVTLDASRNARTAPTSWTRTNPGTRRTAATVASVSGRRSVGGAPVITPA
jgi:hypothetical protein